MSFKVYSRSHGLAMSALCLSIAVAQSAMAADLDEVQVIAKKRQQSATNVDIAVNVLDPQLLNALNFRSLPDAAAFAENVAMFEDFSGASLPTWVIRGVGVQDYNANNTPTAAVYLDGSYQVSTVMGAASLFDVEELEILKGPQGGLYGRNTTGGAVILQSRRAKLDQRETNVEVGYGRWGSSVVRSALNLPLNESTAVRVAINAENSRGGWQRSLSMDGTQGDKEKLDARVWWHFEVSDKLRLDWKLQGGRDDSDIPLGRSLGVYAADGSGNYCDAVLAGYIDENTCINWAGVNLVHLGTGVPERLLDQSDDGSVVLSQLLNRQDNDYVGTVLELTWELDFADFLSLSTFDRFGYGVLLDLDGSGGEYGHRRSTSDLRTWSQEFRLLSKPESRVRWLAGLNYSREDFEEFRDFRAAENRFVGLGRGLMGYDQDTEALSIYVDAELPLSSQWAIAGGLRWTDEDKNYRNGAFWIPREPPIYLSRNLSSDYRLDERLAGSLALHWKPQENTFGYIKYSSGFKSGGFYGGFPFDPREIEPYREETLVAWEAGMKVKWPDAGLELGTTLFYYELEDVQGFIRDTSVPTGTGIDRLANQGDAVHKGVELHGRWQVMDALSLELGLGWLDARFRGEDVLTLNLADELVPVTGRRPYAPSFNGHFLVSHARTLGDAHTLILDASYDYRSAFSGHQSSLVDAAINDLPGFGLVNFAARVNSARAPWELGLWVRNATNERYVTRVKNDGLNSFIALYGEPRSYGVTLSYRL